MLDFLLPCCKYPQDFVSGASDVMVSGDGVADGRTVIFVKSVARFSDTTCIKVGASIEVKEASVCEVNYINNLWY